MLRRQQAHYHRDLPDPCVHDEGSSDLLTVAALSAFLLLSWLCIGVLVVVAGMVTK